MLCEWTGDELLDIDIADILREQWTVRGCQSTRRALDAGG